MKYSKEELMVVTGAREIKDYDKVLVGIGLPMACAILAKLTHAPHSVIFFENGVVDPKSTDYGVGLADLKAWSGASYYTGTLEVMGYMLHGGKFDVGFVGVLEVDMYGNVNSTIVEVNGKPRHFTGSGGGNDIVSLARKIIVITRHEKRKIKEKVFYVTSPGYIGGRDRREVGLRGGDIVVITDMAVLKFNKNKGRMDVVSIHPGIKIEEVINNTGFPLEIPSDVPTTPEPTEHELKVLREKVPATLYSKSL
ncbi:MAG: CoA-transferase [Desulfurococcaceae archaeon]|jgi:acyl CoA:acetate/3-ketoacid CoA transferase beta subunit